MLTGWAAAQRREYRLQMDGQYLLQALLEPHCETWD